MKTRVTIVNVVIFCRTTISTEISHDVQEAHNGKKWNVSDMQMMHYMFECN